MCLAVPVLITKIEGTHAIAEIGGVRRKISITLTPEAKVHDYVLVHAGYAIGILNEEEAEETLKCFEAMAAFHEDKGLRGDGSS